MRYFIWTLKLLLGLIFSFSYLCMMKILYCGCWACKAGVAISVMGLLLFMYDRVVEFRAIKKKK